VFQNKKIKLDIHTLKVISNSSKTIIVKIAGMVAGLLISVFLAQTLGPEGIGIINFANGVGIILLLFSMFGFQNVIIKFVAIAKKRLDNKSVITTLKTSLFFNGLLSILIAVIGVIALPFILDMWPDRQNLHIPLMIVFVMIVPQTISRVYGFTLNGYGKIWQANLVNQALSLILVGIGFIIYWNLEIKFTPTSVLLLYAISRTLMVMIVILIWRQTFKSKIKGGFNFKPMFKMAKPMLLVSGTSIIASKADVIMIGILGTFDEVGIYSIAAQLAMMTSLFLVVINSAIKPKLASLFANNSIDELRNMVQRVTKILIFLALLFVIFFIVMGQWILGFWGTEFQEAYWILVILSIGQFFNISTGCSGTLLIMCGFEKSHGYISVVEVILNILLNLIFIINFGALGAAYATASTVIFSNITKVILAKRKTGILTLPRNLKLSEYFN